MFSNNVRQSSKIVICSRWKIISKIGKTSSRPKSGGTSSIKLQAARAITVFWLKRIDSFLRANGTLRSPIPMISWMADGPGARRALLLWVVLPKWGFWGMFPTSFLPNFFSGFPWGNDFWTYESNILAAIGGKVRFNKVIEFRTRSDFVHQFYSTKPSTPWQAERELWSKHEEKYSICLADCWCRDNNCRPGGIFHIS